jgi:hypothetical protein
MAAQPADDCGDVVFLEEADGGDAGCSGLQAGFGILQSDPSEGEDGDFGATGLAESVEAFRAGSGGIFFFEDGGEEGHVRAAGCGLDDFFWGVTGDGDPGFSDRG